MLNLELRLNNEAVAKLEINSGLISRLFHAVVSPAAEPVEPTDPRGHARHTPLSSPLTKAQAEELLAQVDKTSAEFLKRIAANHGALTWGETKALFDLKDWEGYSSGPGRKILHAVRQVTHDKAARLVWRIEHEWEGLEKGEDEVCRLHIDGAALQALREATGHV
jgi:hypothetical protein